MTAIRRPRGMVCRLAFVGAMVGMLGSSIVVSPAHAVGDVCDGFAQNVFIDDNGNGIADSNGIMATPWFDAVTDDLDSNEYEFDVPVESSVQFITIKPGAVPNMANGKADADLAIQCSTSGGVVVTATASVSFLNVVNPQNFWARLTIQPRSGGSPIQGSECNDLVKASKTSSAAEPPVELLLTLDPSPCVMPSNAASYRLKIRAHIDAPGSSGTVIFHSTTMAVTNPPL